MARRNTTLIPISAALAVISLTSCRGGDSSAPGSTCDEYFDACCTIEEAQQACDETARQVERLLEQEGDESAEAACEAALETAQTLGLCDTADGDGDSDSDGDSDGDTDGDGDGDVTPARATCTQYLSCLAEVDELLLAAALEAYGVEGSCWETLSQTQCRDACAEGLSSLRELPGVTDNPACGECSSAIPCLDPSTPRCRLGTCVECLEDDDCPGGCDTRESLCVQCTRDEHCGGALPACDDHRCVQCNTDDHCDGSRPACDSSTHRCIGCTRDEHCPAELPVCDRASGACLECRTDEHCGGDRPRCGQYNRCVVCQEDADCPSDRPVCFGPLLETPSCRECTIYDSGRCGDSERCRDGECIPLTCSDVSRDCGVEVFEDGERLECGGCDAPQECDHRQLFSWWDDPLWIHTCGLTAGSECDPRDPESCGRAYRCVWNEWAGDDAGLCVADETGVSCLGEEPADCPSQFGRCLDSECRPKCDTDAHCLEDETCVELSYFSLCVPT